MIPLQQQTIDVTANITTLTIYNPPPPAITVRAKQEITREDVKRTLANLMVIPLNLEKNQSRPSQV